MPGLAAGSSPGEVFEMQALRPHPTFNESETLGMSEICVLTSCLGDLGAH
jgi:hypothetical protein